MRLEFELEQWHLIALACLVGVVLYVIIGAVTAGLLERLVEGLAGAGDIDAAPELFAQRRDFLERFFEGGLGAGHAAAVPHDLAEALVEVADRLLAVDRQEARRHRADRFLGALELEAVRARAGA